MRARAANKFLPLLYRVVKQASGIFTRKNACSYVEGLNFPQNERYFPSRYKSIIPVRMIFIWWPSITNFKRSWTVSLWKPPGEQQRHLISDPPRKKDYFQFFFDRLPCLSPSLRVTMSMKGEERTCGLPSAVLYRRMWIMDHTGTYGLQMGAVRIDDISTHKCTVMRLQQRLERNHISPLHLVDAVEDFLAAD